MKKYFSNLEIIEMCQKINENSIGQEKYIPISLNFFIQKNILTLQKLCDEIIFARNLILTHYQEIDEENKRFIPADKIDIVNNEIDELFQIQQEVDIITIPLQAFIDNNVQLNTSELLSIMFMIDEQNFLEPSLTLVETKNKSATISVNDIT